MRQGQEKPQFESSNTRRTQQGFGMDAIKLMVAEAITRTAKALGVEIDVHHSSTKVEAKWSGNEVDNTLNVQVTIVEDLEAQAQPRAAVERVP